MKPAGKPFSRWLALYLTLGFGLFVGYLLFSPYIPLPGSGTSVSIYIAYEGNSAVRAAMLCCIAALAVLCIILLILRRLNFQKGSAALILAGIVMRFGYMLYTPYFIRGHDVGNIAQDGHAGYIWYIYQCFSLPDSYSGQFYHPPLNHILCAAVAHIYQSVTGTGNSDAIMESTRLVPCFASCALIMVCLRIFEELGLSKKATMLALSIIAFHPALVLLSASINNDILMILLFSVAFLYTVRWYRSPSMKNILILALAIAFAMLTKFSAALIAIFTAAVFIIKWLGCKDTPLFKKIFLQFVAFAAVCVPLGMSYSIRNLILFGQPIGYVAQIGENSSLYVGGYSALERFFSFPVNELFSSFFGDVYDDYNLWIYVIKSSLFGEFTFSAPPAVTMLLILCNFCLIILSLAAMIIAIAKYKGESLFIRFGLPGLWFILMLSFVCFNIKYPFGCTMDFRYIVPTVFIGAALLGVFWSRQSKSAHLLPIFFYTLTGIFSAGFIAGSVLLFTL